jgi:hypothetical protein
MGQTGFEYNDITVARKVLAAGRISLNSSKNK